MASNENRALTAAEMEEIAEYERIVEFADQVLAGTHPRVKIPAHMVSSDYVFAYLIFTIFPVTLVSCRLGTFSQ
jgi:hypothetical protein